MSVLIRKKISLFAIFWLILVSPFLMAQGIPEKVQRGISLLNSGKIDEAAAVLQDVIQSDPNHGPARLLLGQIAMEQNKWNEAEQHLKIAVVSAVKRPYVAWQLLGKLYLFQHRYADARQSFEEALRQSPDFSPALVGRAHASLFLGDTSAALKDVQTINSPEMVLLRSQMLFSMDRIAEAKEQLGSVRFENEDQARSAKILLAAMSEDPSAEKQIKSYISENLGDSTGYVALALWQQKQSKANPKLLEMAFQLDDQNPIPLLLLKNKSNAKPAAFKTPLPEIVRKIAAAESAFKAGKFKEARDHAGKILEERPLHLPAELLAISAAEREQNYWNALEGYNDIHARIPGIPVVESRSALLAQKMKAYSLAECHARAALQVQPQNGYFHHVLASILHSQKKIDEALKEAQLAIESGYEGADAYVTLGNLYYEKMEISRSIAALKTAVEKDPHSAEDIASFALSALTSEDYESLKTMLEAHVKANPENTGSLYGLARMAMNENNQEQAQTYLIQLRRLAPNNLEVHYNLGLVSFRLGQEKEGQEAMARFQELKQKELEDWEKHNKLFRLRSDAKQAMSERKHEEAVRIYSQLVTDPKAELEDWVALGKANSAMGKHEQGLKSFTQAIEISPYDSEALKGAAESAAALRKTEFAEQQRHRYQLISMNCSSQ